MIRKKILLLLICFNCTCAQDNFMKRNNLYKETSPYLIQHKSNPVHWQRWSQDLYKQQNKENKLLIVSIGYSSCHWCHVMEKETFKDQQVAEIMNADFINIKVDREENPDVDNIYMTSVQLMTGSGGWPLNVITLSDGRPIYGGTYHTKEQWINVLDQVQKIYLENPSRLEEIAQNIENGLQAYNTIEVTDRPSTFSTDSINLGVENWKKTWDFQYGGEKSSQKFIVPVRYQFLMQYQKITGNLEINAYILNSLKKIANSGVFDPIEGGFYRYSVDPFWEVPHFEKMLYDNAQLIGLFATAYKKYNTPLFKNRAYEIFDFMEEHLQDSSGAYYAAIDADNQLGEGRYYIWTQQELKQLILENWDLFVSFYSIDFSKPFNQEFYILRQSKSINQFASENGLTEENLQLKIDYWKNQLKGALSKRDFPTIDNKLLASWNALAIKGLAQAYQAFGDEQFLNKAITIFNFVEKEMIVSGDLFHTHQQGKVKIEGFLEDYAHLIEAALFLYQVTGNTEYIETSEKLTQVVLADFSLNDQPYFSFKKDQPLITQILSTEDNVLPSSNSIMANNLFLLGQLLQDQPYIERAKNMLLGMHPQIIEYTSGYTLWASLYTTIAYGFYEVIVNGSEAKQISKELLRHFLPEIIFQQSEIEGDLPLLKDRFDPQQTYIYVCQNRVCLLPVTNTSDALEQLENFSISNTKFPNF